jgi:hypothetical protein
MDEVIITLQQSVDVAIDGAAIACDEVVLRPPTGRVQSQVQFLPGGSTSDIKNEWCVYGCHHGWWHVAQAQAITGVLAFMAVIMKETTHGSNPRSD